MTPFSLFSDLSATGFQPQTIEFQYDELGRRISKDVYDGVDTSTSLVSSTIFFYGGWNLIAEVDDSGASEEVVRTYTWGLDLSGSDQGAGGVGGLLMVHEGSKTHFVAMDGNGNVSALTDGTTVTAEYEYGLFGEVLKVLGEIGDEMPIRFSSKYQDFETGLVYYGYRYYSNQLGRWLNRDPIQEDGGVNILNFVYNDSVNNYDVLGLSSSFANPKAAIFAFRAIGYEQFAAIYGSNLARLVALLSASMALEMNESELRQDFVNMINSQVNCVVKCWKNPNFKKLVQDTYNLMDTIWNTPRIHKMAPLIGSGSNWAAALEEYRTGKKTIRNGRETDHISKNKDIFRNVKNIIKKLNSTNYKIPKECMDMLNPFLHKLSRALYEQVKYLKDFKGFL
jgi:RHS repeat-associated protein